MSSQLIKSTSTLCICICASLLACEGGAGDGDTEAEGTSSSSSGPTGTSNPTEPQPTTGGSGTTGTGAITEASDDSSTVTTETTAGQTGDDTVGETGAEQLGNVDFVAVYEAGSAWESNPTAQEMVDTVFADFESTLRTSGPWNATIEVYLTDDNTGTANTSFDGTYSEATVDGQTVLVVPAWQKIVAGAEDPNGPAMPDGTGTEFIVHFNVAGNDDNAGLLRHEMMHGMGAVNSISNLSMTDRDSLVGPTVGERRTVSLYDLQLIDQDGMPLLDDYDDADGTFEIQPYVVETTYDEWGDGNAGVSFHGVTPDGGTLDMPCATFSISETQRLLVLNEPRELMSAGSHPTWHTIDEPDWAFLVAMHYEVVR